MAKGENQSVVIAMIIFIILTIVLLVTTVLYVKQYQEERARADKDHTDLLTTQRALRDAQTDVEQLKTWIGANATDSLEDVDTQFKADMQAYAEGLVEEQWQYREALKQQNDTLVQTRQDLNAKNDNIIALEDTQEKREALHAKQTDQVREEFVKESSGYTDERAKLTEEKTSLARSQQELNDRIAALLKEKDELDAKIAQMATDVATTKEDHLRTVTRQKRTIDELRSESFEVADGEIRSVFQDRNVVWINLGSADHLRRQITFSVFGEDEDNPNRYSPKGKIEVTDLFGDHLAEARITEDLIADPIVRGDKIYTSLWHPGRPQRFALAGFMDVDGDGASDRKRIRDLIELSGGIIDAELDDDGTENGAMTYDTRYLVIGDQKKSVVGKIGAWRSKAEELGISTLKLDEFLDFIGYHDTTRSLRPGETPPIQFRPRQKDPALQPKGPTTGIFQPRGRPQISNTPQSNSNGR